MPEMFDFRPNWRDSTVVQREFKTDIFTSRSGKEQRQAVRNEPRKTIEYTVSLHRNRMRAFQRLMARFQASPITMGDPTRKSLSVTAMVIASNTVTVADEPLAWLLPGATVMLESGDTRELLVVSSVELRVVTFVSNTTKAWPIGTAVRPTVSGLLETSIDETNITDELAEAKITLSVDPGSEPIFINDAGVLIHNGREVFPFNENWGQSLSTKFEQDRDEVDFGYGRIDSFVPTAFGAMTRQSSYLGATATQAQAMSDFFERMKGQQGEFYWPTGTADLVPSAGLVEGTTALRVVGRETFDAFNNDTVYKAVAIRLFDGRMLYRSIASMAVSGGDTTVIQFTAPWLFNMPQSQILSVSWLLTSRFASDQFAEEWLTEEVVQAQMSIRTLEDLPAESPITVYDGAAQWVLENWGVDAGIDIMDRFDWMVNVLYPAIFFIPEAWVRRGEADVDRFDVLVNVRYPAIFD